MVEHEKYMQRCLDLALLGLGSVSPNPLVGAVVVCGDLIIGEGYHQKYGSAHAEVAAINAVLSSHSNSVDLLKRSTIYVNLEPCAHYGKTPPCADLIIRHEIPHVVIGCLDPFERVNGKGIEKLLAAGIKVTTGVLKKGCLELNKRFFTRVQKQRPYIILKWAETVDGFFAPTDGSQIWISSHLSKKLVHRWRAEEDAVLVGKNTALIDNPQLNVRHWKGRNPVRILVDRRLELPAHLHLFDQSIETIVFNEVKTETVGKTKFLQVEDFDHYLPQLIAFQLYLMDIQSVIIEGGVQTLNLFIEAGLWDEARVFTGVRSWGSGLNAPQLTQKITGSTAVTGDELAFYFNDN